MDTVNSFRLSGPVFNVTSGVQRGARRTACLGPKGSGQTEALDRKGVVHFQNTCGDPNKEPNSNGNKDKHLLFGGSSLTHGYVVLELV